MKCPACGSYNPDGTRSCASCGYELEQGAESALKPVTAAPAQKTQGQRVTATAEEVKNVGKEVANIAVDLHNRRVNFKCGVFGAVYVLFGLGMLTSPTVDEKWVPLVVLAYAAWLISGCFTGGWRLIIY